MIARQTFRFDVDAINVDPAKTAGANAPESLIGSNAGIFQSAIAADDRASIVIVIPRTMLDDFTVAEELAVTGVWLGGISGEAGVIK
ncbi:hypothetical protein BST65_01565 [Bradyrhizobium canariense]|nr:hypothetical protein BST65_01565 [Bradyrhizobium canariense]OSI38622.1 hypothetical protein BST66_02175 [Bradyrhizobium canariense]OSI55274.1 hypothetical protein BSZ20_01855 [Bradyrhizobium canariense]OSI56960.1 hypothetical protein BST67_02545 [Bradyrhizobium canariense]OSI59774.1 hypothetical protein BSZ15_03055 [Bradyrhizobium canariense]